MKTILLLLLLYLVPATNMLIAQDAIKTMLFRIEMKDGKKYTGKIISENTDRIVLETGTDTITLLSASVKSRELLTTGQIKNGVFRSENPRINRYFMATDCYGLRKGEANYNNVWIIFNQVQYGVSDHLTLGGGVMPIIFFDWSAIPVWVTAKLSFTVIPDKFNVAVGTAAGILIGQSGKFLGFEVKKTHPAFGSVYAKATLGSWNNNLTLGTGFLFAGGRLTENPVFNVAAKLQLTRRIYLMADDYITFGHEDSGDLLIIGTRWFFKRCAFDTGLMAIFNQTGGKPDFSPWLSMNIPFGRLN